MTSLAELLSRVDASFVETGAGFEPWDDPHPDRMPADEEYSRVTNPAKWRIVGARADAWLNALVDASVATVDRIVDVRWTEESRATHTRIDRAAPHATGAVPLVIARGAIEGVDDAGVTIGVGDPTMVVESIPDCGCDACDSGSQDALDQLDEYLVAIVSGQYRRLEKGRQSITLMPNSRQASNMRLRSIESILAKPRGWTEVNGASWLGPK